MPFLSPGADLEYESLGRFRGQFVSTQAARHITWPFWICQLCTVGKVRAIDSLGIWRSHCSGSWKKAWFWNYGIWKWWASRCGELEGLINTAGSYCWRGIFLCLSVPLPRFQHIYKACNILCIHKTSYSLVWQFCFHFLPLYLPAVRKSDCIKMAQTDLWGTKLYRSFYWLWSCCLLTYLLSFFCLSFSVESKSLSL